MIQLHATHQSTMKNLVVHPCKRKENAVQQGLPNILIISFTTQEILTLLWKPMLCTDSIVRQDQKTINVTIKEKL